MLSTDAVHPNSHPNLVRSHRSNIRILLVDDDPIILAVLKELLTREGYRVIDAASSASALELAAKSTFDMLVTDYQLPEADGFVLASRLTENRIALPVLILSGSNLSDSLLVEIAGRRWSFLSKPIDRERLLRIIDGECLGWALRMRASIAR